MMMNFIKILLKFSPEDMVDADEDEYIDIDWSLIAP